MWSDCWRLITKNIVIQRHDMLVTKPLSACLHFEPFDGVKDGGLEFMEQLCTQWLLMFEAMNCLDLVFLLSSLTVASLHLNAGAQSCFCFRANRGAVASCRRCKLEQPQYEIEFCQWWPTGSQVVPDLFIQRLYEMWWKCHSPWG